MEDVLGKIYNVELEKFKNEDCFTFYILSFFSNQFEASLCHLLQRHFSNFLTNNSFTILHFFVCSLIHGGKQDSCMTYGHYLSVSVNLEKQSN